MPCGLRRTRNTSGATDMDKDKLVSWLNERIATHEAFNTNRNFNEEIKDISKGTDVILLKRVTPVAKELGVVCNIEHDKDTDLLPYRASFVFNGAEFVAIGASENDV